MPAVAEVDSSLDPFVRNILPIVPVLRAPAGNRAGAVSAVAEGVPGTTFNAVDTALRDYRRSRLRQGVGYPISRRPGVGAFDERKR